MDISSYRTEIASLIRTINKEKETHSEKTIPLCNKLEEYGAAQGDDALIGYACFVRGEFYYHKNDILGFYREMLKCMEPLERIGEWGYLAMADNMLGIMSLNRGNAPFALDYYYKADTICKEYSLPDIEWVIQMNMGALFLSVGSPEEAIRRYNAAYEYILAHKDDMAEFKQSLTAAAVGLGRGYMQNGDLEMASRYEAIIELQCTPFISKSEEINVYSFLARFYNEKKDKENKDKAIKKVIGAFSSDIPIMDFFDDLYDFLSLLLETEDYATFSSLVAPINGMVKKTSIKNMQQKLLDLLLQFYNAIGDKKSYIESAVRYYENESSMAHENDLMIKSMIKLRQSFYNLSKENSEIAAKTRSLEKKSETDPLTAMYNRFRLNKYAEIAFKKAIDNQTGLAVEILDIDFFKEYNDNYGHQAGDRVIKYIADSIKKLQKDNNIFAARYGGDEFVMIYEGYTREEVFGLAKQLKQIVNSGHVEHKYSRTNTKYVTISQGVFWGIPEEGGSVWHYLHEADGLLYKVKTRSRNSIMVGHLPIYTSGMEEPTEGVLVTETEDGD